MRKASGAPDFSDDEQHDRQHLQVATRRDASHESEASNAFQLLLQRREQYIRRRLIRQA
jgi:hypothetical protein